MLPSAPVAGASSLVRGDGLHEEQCVTNKHIHFYIHRDKVAPGIMVYKLSIYITAVLTLWSEAQ